MASNTIARTASDAEQRAFRLIAGECRIETTGPTDRTHHGQVLVVVKPDGTVLVHDVRGFKPVAWMTRAETVNADEDTGILTAVDGDHWLRVEVKREVFDQWIPGSPAGRPLGNCPGCGGRLVAAGGDVHCVGCRRRFGLPDEATLLEDRCECGFPVMRIERGAVFDLCIDRECDPMETAIAERFDGEWSCPSPGCPGHLRIIRRRRILAACDQYPECDVAFDLPKGVVDGHCGCGLPRFASGDELRCLDASCESVG